MDEVAHSKPIPDSSTPSPLFEVRYAEDPHNTMRMSNENLVVVHHGTVIARQSDGGKAEDNLFSRDYAWIKPLLEKAYALGVADKRDELIP